MINKVSKGRSFKNVLLYLSSKENAQLIFSNMGAKTIKNLCNEFQAIHSVKPFSKAVYHASLSIPQTDALTTSQWICIAKSYLKQMGFVDNQYLIYKHNDTSHHHIHILANRICVSNGYLVKDNWDYLRGEKIMRDLEQKYQLTPTISSKDVHKSSYSRFEKESSKGIEIRKTKDKLIKLIDKYTLNPIFMSVLINKLQNNDISVRINKYGISYKINDLCISGSKLGKAYTFQGLQRYKSVINDFINANFQYNAHELVEVQKYRERVLFIAPILINMTDILNVKSYKTKNFAVEWQFDNRVILMKRTKDSELILAARYDGKNFEPIDLPLKKYKSPLLSKDVDSWYQNKIVISHSNLDMALKNSNSKYCL